MDKLVPDFDRVISHEPQPVLTTAEKRRYRRSLEKIYNRDKLDECFKVSVGLFVMRFNADDEEPNNIIEIKAQESKYAASINKLALAHFFVKTATSHSEIDSLLDKSFEIQKEDIRQGIGSFDSTQAVGCIVSFSELLNDMLKNSGNTATTVLGNGIAQDVNQHLKQSGFEATNLTPLDNGKFILGQTNARDAAYLMRDLVVAEGPIAEVAQEALRTSLSPFFDRQDKSSLLPANSDLFIKYGQFNGDEDITYAVRHEVGALREVNGVTTVYAILTKYPKTAFFNIPRVYFAKTAIQSLEAEILFGLERRAMESFALLGQMGLDFLKR